MAEKLLRKLPGAERLAFAATLKSQLVTLKRTVPPKQHAVVDRMAKAVAEVEEECKKEGFTLPIDANSAAPTPVLTREPNTPQSTSPPSTNASAVGEATEDTESTKTATTGDFPRTSYPEVRVDEV